MVLSMKNISVSRHGAITYSHAGAWGNASGRDGGAGGLMREIERGKTYIL
jgi:hypothetical protein